MRSFENFTTLLVNFYANQQINLTSVSSFHAMLRNRFLWKVFYKKAWVPTKALGFLGKIKTKHDATTIEQDLNVLHLESVSCFDQWFRPV